ncbi:mce associated protein mas1a [Prescottella soli]|uniref:Mce associated protein mas1a n=1 Tax=Prescottella soli TaxID=1543852 RepID=A0ABW9FZW6_9NOCA
MANDETGIDTTDAAVATATAEPDPGQDDSSSAPRGTRGRVTVTILGALIVVLAAALGWQMWQQHRADMLRTEAVDTTRDYAQTIATFDYQNLDANRGKIAAMSTPEFAGKYNEMVDALSKLVTDGQGRATATVTNIGVESIDGSNAVVLAFVDQEAKNVIAPEGKSQNYRMVVTLTRDGDRWIVDNVETK